MKRASRLLLPLLLALWPAGCGDEGALPDGTPPSRIEDLVGFPRDTVSVLLTWTAPGDDADAGRASRYDARLSLELPAVWERMVRLEGEPSPREAGEADSFVVGGLEPGITVHFRIAAADEADNWSEPSHVASVAPLEGVDRTPPAPIGDLRAIRVEPESIRLAWTAPGDNGWLGRASAYDLRYWTGEISGWDLATRVDGVGPPTPAGEPDSFTVGGLEPDRQYRFAIRTADEVPNWSSLSNVVETRTGRADDRRWWEGFAPAPRGMGIEGTVRALVVFGDRLVAAGHFPRAGGVETRNVASWDGQRWTALGTGTNGSIRSAIVHGGDLVVSGSFTNAGGVEALGLARFDGASWHAMGDSSVAGDGPLALFEGDLVAAGRFTAPAWRIGRWDGVSWTPIPDLPLREISALAELDGRLIAGGVGSYDRQGTPYVLYSAAFDGEEWEFLDFEPGFEQTGDVPKVEALLSEGGILWEAATGELGHVRRWDGGGWTVLSGLLRGAFDGSAVLALARFGSDLHAGGEFSIEGAFDPYSIARWDGSAWSSLGSGVRLAEPQARPSVHALAVYRGDLYVGGRFEQAGKKPSGNIARYRPAP